MLKLSVYDAFVRLRDKWRHMRRMRSSLAELAAYPPGELQRIAEDAGVSVTDLRLAAAHPGPRELLPLRLRLLGLDPAYVSSALTGTCRDLERTCAMCRSWRRCARDLARGDVQAGMDSYCLCSPTIDALTVDQPVRPSAMTTQSSRPRGQRLSRRLARPLARPLSRPMSRHVERRAVRMHEMMQRLNVDPSKLARLRRGGAYAEARARCLSCRASERCLLWLDEPKQADRRPDFCPNLLLFETCRQDRP